VQQERKTILVEVGKRSFINCPLLAFLKRSKILCGTGRAWQKHQDSRMVRARKTQTADSVEYPIVFDRPPLQCKFGSWKKALVLNGKYAPAIGSYQTFAGSKQD